MLGILFTSGIFNLVSSGSESWLDWLCKPKAKYFSVPLFLF